MSNHVHFILGTNGGNKLEEIIRDFKKFTSKTIHKAIQDNPAESRKEWLLNIFLSFAANSNKHKEWKFWQDEYHPIELINFEMVRQKLEYIHDNPVRRGIVFNPWEYCYSSAVDYQTNRKGLLPITFLY